MLSSFSPLVIAFLDKLRETTVSVNISTARLLLLIFDIFQQDKRDQLLRRLLDILRRDVCPAYERLLNVLRGDLANASSDHGVWKLPEGDRFYELCLEFHTTTKMSPDEVHEMGKKHVDRIQNEMRQ